jgi:hypothetical protein
MSVNWDAVAERLRTVVSASSDADIARTAERIGLREEMLRESLNGRSRLSAIKVIAALTRYSGVDPGWILTGEFDSATHRRALEGSADDVEALVKAIIGDLSRDQKNGGDAHA